MRTTSYTSKEKKGSQEPSRLIIKKEEGEGEEEEEEEVPPLAIHPLQKHPRSSRHLLKI
jgi:hypothetical protein